MESVDRYVEVLRQAAHAPGPEVRELLVNGQAEEVASELARDMWAFVDGLACVHRQLEARRESWVARMRSFRATHAAAIAEIDYIEGQLEDVLTSVAIGHRRRTGEATIELPSGSKIGTRHFTSRDVAVRDEFLLANALRGREGVPDEVWKKPDLALTAAKAYAKQVLEDKDASELLPGVEVLPAGRTTANVSHGNAAE